MIAQMYKHYLGMAQVVLGFPLINFVTLVPSKIVNLSFFREAKHNVIKGKWIRDFGAAGSALD